MRTIILHCILLHRVVILVWLNYFSTKVLQLNLSIQTTIVHYILPHRVVVLGWWNCFSTKVLQFKLRI